MGKLAKKYVVGVFQEDPIFGDECLRTLKKEEEESQDRANPYFS